MFHDRTPSRSTWFAAFYGKSWANGLLELFRLCSHRSAIFYGPFEDNDFDRSSTLFAFDESGESLCSSFEILVEPRIFQLDEGLVNTR